MIVCILISTYNGEKFLREQLESLLTQTISVKILVRDDGSTDSTCDILEEYKSNGKLIWYAGDNLRPAKSFWDLVKNAPQADYYAFCDQDDVWFNDKIERAIKTLQQAKNQNQPLLYCSNVVVTNAELKPYGNMNSGSAYTDFAHSLIYSLAPGCTMVFNDNAIIELKKYDMNEEFEIIHDWLTHKIIAMLGEVIYDEKPSMYYRQHGNNVIGAQQGGRIKQFIKKVRRIFGSYANVRSESAKSLLNVYGSRIGEDERYLLNLVANYRKNKKLKKAFIKSKRFRISKKSYLKIAIRLNKV